MARILLIDDEASLIRTLKDILSFEGHYVELYTDAETVLQDKVYANFDIIFVDFKMPNLNGGQFYEQLRATGFIKPVVMMSSYSRMELSCKISPKVFLELFTVKKPLDLKEFLKVLEIVISENPSPR